MATADMLSQAFHLVTLLTLLFPAPGNLQYAVNVGRCNKGAPESCPSAILFKEYVKRIIDHERCPDNILIKFVLPKKIFYGKVSEGWVQDLEKCLTNDKKTCLLSPDGGYKNQCPNTKPITKATITTTTTTTTIATAVTSATTQAYKDHALVPTEIAPSMSTSPQNDDVNLEESKHLQKGSKEQPGPDAVPFQPQDGQTPKSTMIAIISLIVICLVLVAVLTGVFCRKKRKNSYRRPSSQDALI